MISECRLVVIGCRDQAAILRKRDAAALADRATDKAEVFEAVLQELERKQEDAEILEWVDRNRDKIKQRMSY